MRPACPKSRCREAVEMAGAMLFVYGFAIPGMAVWHGGAWLYEAGVRRGWWP